MGDDHMLAIGIPIEDFLTIESLIEDCSDGFNNRYRNEVSQGLPVSQPVAQTTVNPRVGDSSLPEGAFVRVRTLATKRVNARRREIDRRAFFVSRQEITRICEFFKAGSYDSLRSLFEERFPECECNLQGCA